MRRACRATAALWSPTTVASVASAYYFSNRSDDIRVLFCSALDDRGIPRTRNAKHQVAIYRKAATARLDEFVGPKA